MQIRKLNHLTHNGAAEVAGTHGCHSTTQRAEDTGTESFAVFLPQEKKTALVLSFCPSFLGSLYRVGELNFPCLQAKDPIMSKR